MPAQRFEVLIICTGNVCRSPMAEYLFRAQVRPGALVVSSAGTLGLVGEPMDPPSAAALKQVGVDGSSHRGRRFTPGLARSADLVLTAERAHRDGVMSEVPTAFRRVFTLAEFARMGTELVPRPMAGPHAVVRAVGALTRTDHGAADDVVDPYGASVAEARAVLDHIAECVDAAIATLRLPRVSGHAGPVNASVNSA